jgi:hypothetical protein
MIDEKNSKANFFSLFLFLGTFITIFTAQISSIGDYS